MCVNTPLQIPGGMQAPPQQAPSAPSVGDGRYRPEGNPEYVNMKVGGRMSGSDNMARLYRAQFEDYKQRFQPIEQMLVDRAGDDRYRQGKVNEAGLTMGDAMDNARAQNQRSLSRRGVNPTGDMAEATRRSFERNKAGAQTDAKNTATAALEDQKMGLMTGGLSTASSQMRRQ